MKQLSTLANLVAATAALMLMAACQTVATNDAELAASRKEFLLAQSGFKVITVTTSQQQQAIKWPDPVQGIGRERQWQVVLRISDCEEGQNLRGETKAIQYL